MISCAQVMSMGKAKDRWNKAHYDQIAFRVDKQTAEAFKAKCQAAGTAQAKILKDAISKFLEEDTSMKDYGKDDFYEMIRDWQADGAPEYDDLVIDDPLFECGEWVAYARDESTEYMLHDDGTGNIRIEYCGTR